MKSFKVLLAVLFGLAVLAGPVAANEEINWPQKGDGYDIYMMDNFNYMIVAHKFVVTHDCIASEENYFDCQNVRDYSKKGELGDPDYTTIETYSYDKYLLAGFAKLKTLVGNRRVVAIEMPNASVIMSPITKSWIVRFR